MPKKEKIPIFDVKQMEAKRRGVRALSVLIKHMLENCMLKLNDYESPALMLEAYNRWIDSANTWPTQKAYSLKIIPDLYKLKCPKSKTSYMEQLHDASIQLISILREGTPNLFDKNLASVVFLESIQSVHAFTKILPPEQCLLFEWNPSTGTFDFKTNADKVIAEIIAYQGIFENAVIDLLPDNADNMWWDDKVPPKSKASKQSSKAEVSKAKRNDDDDDDSSSIITSTSKASSQRTRSEPKKILRRGEKEDCKIPTIPEHPDEDRSIGDKNEERDDNGVEDTRGNSKDDISDITGITIGGDDGRKEVSSANKTMSVEDKNETDDMVSSVASALQNFGKGGLK